MAISDLVRDSICRLKPYSPGKPIEEVEREFGVCNVIKLASNENPLGPSPKAIEAMRKVLDFSAIYPDGSYYYFIKRLAGHCGVDENMITVGNGSDDLIHMIGLTFLREGGEVIVSETTFSQYECAATLNGCCCRTVPLKNAAYDLDAIADAITDKTRIVFIANPNNPTGTAVLKDQVARFMDRVPKDVLVVFDEAYNEYVEDPEFPDMLEYVRAGRNVIVLHTFSKIYALAGLRVGYAVASPELIQLLNKVREPFNVNSIAQAGAIASLDDPEQVSRSRKSNAAGKKYLYAQFEALGLAYTPTEANFIWFDSGRECRPLFTEMLKKGIILRTGDIFGCPTHMRVTIGTEEENVRFIQALKEVLG
jgi:histidinol-phosphate aminotransferase